MPRCKRRTRRRWRSSKRRGICWTGTVGSQVSSAAAYVVAGNVRVTVRGSVKTVCMCMVLVLAVSVCSCSYIPLGTAAPSVACMVTHDSWWTRPTSNAYLLPTYMMLHTIKNTTRGGSFMLPASHTRAHHGEMARPVARRAVIGYFGHFSGQYRTFRTLFGHYFGHATGHSPDTTGNVPGHDRT